MNNLELNNKKEIQLDINFETDKNDLDRERVARLIDDLNEMYPYAKLRVEYLGNDEYRVGEEIVKEKDLKEKFRVTNEIYKPDENEKWYDK